MNLSFSSALSVAVFSSFFFLGSCVSLKSPVSEKKSSNEIQSSGYLVEQATSIALSEGHRIKVRKKFDAENWHWKNQKALGAPPQSFISPVLVSDDLILLSHMGGGIGLFKKSTTSFLWHRNEKIGVSATPTFDRKFVFYMGMDAHLNKVRLDNGKLVWRRKLSAESHGGISRANGFLYVNTADDAIWALDERSGQVVWSYKRPSPESNVYWSMRGQAVPLLSDNSRFLYIGFSDSYFVALNARNGDVLWERNFRRAGRFLDADSTPVVSRNGRYLYLSVVDDALYVIEARNGRTVWTLPKSSSASPSVDDQKNELLYSRFDNWLVSSTLDTGVVQWKTDLKNMGTASTPTLLNEKLFAVTTSNFGLVIAERKSGKILWKKRLGFGTLAQPVFDGENIYVISSRNYLHTFKLKKIPFVAQK